MALNLWKVGGQPISYNPLPSSNQVLVVKNLNSLVIRFKAKSDSNQTLRITNLTVKDNDYVLNSTFKEFEIDLGIVPSQVVVRYYNPTAYDIIIEDIQLVQKPLPKLTINGIDGFNSGKWTLPSGTVVIDDSSLDFTPVNWTSDVCVLTFSVPMFTDVIFNMDTDASHYFSTVADVALYGWSTEKVKTFNTGANTSLKLRLRGTANGIKRYFKNLMLNVGSIPAPYEPKRGERMVLPIPVKNIFSIYNNVLIPSSTQEGWYEGGVVYVKYPVKSGSIYTLSVTSKPSVGSNGIAMAYRWSNSVGTVIGGVGTLNTSATEEVRKDFQLTVPSDVSNVELYFYGVTHTLYGKYFKDVMLVEGNVAQPYEPYAVQVNKKPKKYVPKKNLFDGELETGGYSVSTGLPYGDANSIRSVNFIPVLPNKQYSIKNYTRSGTGIIALCYRADKTFLSVQSAFNATISSMTFTTPADTYFVKLRIDNTGGFTSDQIMLNEGSVFEPYEPYELVLPQAKTGLRFNGDSYIQLPSMTMDSIEIDCLIDSVQPDTTPVVFHMSDVYGRVNGTVGGNAVTSINGVNNGINILPSNQRYKLKYSFTSRTSTSNVFGALNATQKVKGTLYKVTCYLAGQVVASYDFENPSNIVGDKVIPSAENLIPSFEDVGWTLHSNFKVLGKDIGRLDATGAWQESKLDLPCNVGDKYLLTGKTNNNGFISILSLDSSNNPTLLGDITSVTEKISVTIPSGAVKMRVRTLSSTTGTFDFIKPQLYELSNEGTLVGKPMPQIKPSKRSLYSKR